MTPEKQRTPAPDRCSEHSTTKELPRFYQGEMLPRLKAMKQVSGAALLGEPLFDLTAEQALIFVNRLSDRVDRWAEIARQEALLAGAAS